MAFQNQNSDLISSIDIKNQDLVSEFDHLRPAFDAETDEIRELKRKSEHKELLVENQEQFTPPQRQVHVRIPSSSKVPSYQPLKIEADESEGLGDFKSTGIKVKTDIFGDKIETGLKEDVCTNSPKCGHQKKTISQIQKEWHTRERFWNNKDKSPKPKSIGPFDKYTGEFDQSERFPKAKTNKPLQDTGGSYSLTGAAKRKS